MTDWLTTAASTFESTVLDQLAHEDAEPMAQFLAAQNVLLARVLLERATAKAMQSVFSTTER